MRASTRGWAVLPLSVVVAVFTLLVSPGDASAGLGGSTIVATPYINGPFGLITYQIITNGDDTTADVDMMCWNLAGDPVLQREYQVPAFSKKVFLENELPMDVGMCWHWRRDGGGQKQIAGSSAVGQPGVGGALGTPGTKFGALVPGAIGQIFGGPGGFGDGQFFWENTLGSGRPVAATSFFLGYNATPDSVSVDVNQFNENGSAALRHRFELGPWQGVAFEFQPLSDGSRGGAGDITTVSLEIGGLAGYIFHADFNNSLLSVAEVEADDDSYITYSLALKSKF